MEYKLVKLTDNAERVLAQRYYIRNEKNEIIEDFKGLCKRVSDAIAKAEEESHQSKWANIFYDMMVNLDFLPNSPTLFNAGKERGLLSACFTLDIDDNMQSIMKTLSDAAFIFKGGGGVGLSFNALRPEGELIKTTGGTSSGPVSFMRMFDTMTEVIKQGGKRRGALMGLINIDHRDIEKFISCKSQEGKLSNFNISVGITDDFMYKVKQKDPSSLALWNKIVDGAYNNGEPGVLFINTINSTNPVPHMGKIKSSNPCVTGDTMVAVADGRNAVSFKELAEEGKDVPVYTRNSKGQIDIRTMRNPRKTGENQEIIKINLDNGKSLRTTKNHKFILSSGEEIEAKDLKCGDSLSIMIKKSAPLEDIFKGSNSKSQNYYWINGGLSKIWIMDHRLISRFYNKDFKLWCKKVVHHKDRNGLNNAISNLEIMSKNKHDKLHSINMMGLLNPMNRFPEKNWMNNPIKQEISRKKNHIGKKRTKETKENQSKSKKDLFEKDPSKLEYYKSIGATLVAKYSTKLMESFQKRSEKHLIEFQKKTDLKCYLDGKTVMVERKCDGCGEIMYLPFGKREISYHRECYLKKLGEDNKKRSKKVHINHKVVSIENAGYEDVYNGTVDKFHNLFLGHFEEEIDGRKCFAYINTMQCGEFLFIPYGSCNLGSINLSNMFKEGTINWEKLEKTTRNAVRFLDNVITVNWYPIAEIKDVTTRTRPVGLGIMGFADLLLKLGIRYDSSEAIDHADEIMCFIRTKAYDESVKLGKEKGNFAEFKKTKLSEKYETLRNSMLTVIAPTGTLSLIAGCSSGIEPNFSWHTEMHRIDTVMEEYHPLAYKYLKSKEPLPNYFVTASEISPEWHVRMQAAFQVHTCSAISKTINMPNSATKEDVSKAYMLAWELKCKGLTIYRDGSRTKEVLVKAGKKEVKNQKIQNLIYRDREMDLIGKTRKAKTGCGNSYITVNFDESGYPIEVFKQVSSKGGCDAMAEGLARMTSMALRHGIDIPEIVKQLRSVKCANAISKNVGCLSCPDLMGRVLSDLTSRQKEDMSDTKCPDCGSKLATLEGCVKCVNCGWSKCS